MDPIDDLEAIDALITLGAEAQACGLDLENIALRFYRLLADLGADDGTALVATPFLDALAHIACVATAPAREFSARLARGNSGCDRNGLRVVR